ncbi:hypothetical protein [Flavobacterium sp.]|uniref:hypothetical protein n=1 Tax=Flavobacterium sp. TaxID=239 RepID=UPI00260D9F1A|nr:hypothetical protein [Flavobacterium sp.]
MKTLLIVLNILCLNCFSQKLDSSSIYFVGRGTLSKKELIGERFNLLNMDLTHIGLGLIENDTLRIYNVSSDKKEKNSSLIIETLSSFKNVNDIFYYGIWECKISKKNLKKIKFELLKISKAQIIFDRKFKLGDDNQLYCSEFVFKILKSVKEFNFEASTIELNRIEQQILGNDKLSYIPVDFFLNNKRIIEIKTEYIN